MRLYPFCFLFGVALPALLLFGATSAQTGEGRKPKPEAPSAKAGKDAPPKSFTNSIGMKFVRVPKGTFWMSEYGKNAVKQVEIKQDFYMGVYEVTQGQWQAVMGNNPSVFSRTGSFKGKVKVKNISDEDLKLFPVEWVSWSNAQEFIKRLNEKEKNRGWTYRLPTEAEWEYACRGGATSKQNCSFDFYLDKPTNDLSSHQANFNGNLPAGNAAKGPHLERTTKVGSYKPNQLGIYDMHGNVWEWCQDWYEEGSRRAFRGGSWNLNGINCRAASRSGYLPGNPHFSLGFRLAAVPSGG